MILKPPVPRPTQPVNNMTNFYTWLRSFYEFTVWTNFGKTNNLMLVNLDAGGATSTIIKHPLLTKQSVLSWNGLTVNAQNILLTPPGIYATEANRGLQEWTLTHAANANVDCDFVVAIFG